MKPPARYSGRVGEKSESKKAQASRTARPASRFASNEKLTVSNNKITCGHFFVVGAFAMGEAAVAVSSVGRQRPPRRSGAARGRAGKRSGAARVRPGRIRSGAVTAPREHVCRVTDQSLFLRESMAWRIRFQGGAPVVSFWLRLRCSWGFRVWGFGFGALLSHALVAKCSGFASLRGDVRLDGWTFGRLDGWTVGRLDGWTFGRLDVWTFTLPHVHTSKPSVAASLFTLDS